MATTTAWPERPSRRPHPAERDRLLAVYGGRWALWEEEEQHPLFRGVTGFAVAGQRLVLGQIASPLSEIRWAQRAHRRRSLSGALDLLRAGPFDLRRDVVIPGRMDETATGEGRTGSVTSKWPGRTARRFARTRTAAAT